MYRYSIEVSRAFLIGLIHLPLLALFLRARPAVTKFQHSAFCAPRFQVPENFRKFQSREKFVARRDLAQPEQRFLLQGQFRYRLNPKIIF